MSISPSDHTLSIASRRQEARIPAASIRLPFLATRADGHACFQYMLRDVSINGVGIFSPSWIKNREYLRIGDKINFHVPFQIESKFLNQGEVRWTHWDETSGQSCGALLVKTTPLNYPLYVAFESGDIAFMASESGNADLKALAITLVKDAALLKEGTLIYFKHLQAFFSRVGKSTPENYAVLKLLLLGDVQKHIEDNIIALRECSLRTQSDGFTLDQFSKTIDLEAFRLAIEPEIDVDLFALSFDTTRIVPYLESIKLLEHKLYTNYNTMVLLYLSIAHKSSDTDSNSTP